MKLFKIKLFYFILGVLVAVSSTVFAYSYLAQDIGFTPTDTTWFPTNSKQALDDLHNKIKMHDKFFGSLTVRAWGTSSDSGGNFNLTSDIKKNYKYFKITNKTVNTLNRCVIEAWPSVGSSGVVMELNTQYLTADFIDVYLNITNNSNVYGNCTINITFYNKE